MTEIVYALTWGIVVSTIIIFSLLGSLLHDIGLVVGGLTGAGIGIIIGSILTYDHWKKEIDAYYSKPT